MLETEMEICERRRKNLWMLVGLYGTRIQLAKKLEIPAHELSRYGRGQEVSEKTARQIEAKLKKPIGWLDRPNYSMDLTREEWNIILEHRNKNV